ncbi:MAG: DUF2075 domain-containing protein [Candidatus Dadabacteria bacterium]|nr:DUF2075 domain-containing protein [Candidatus Dadabacteria bacterium]MDE0477303.1 DUF2075 domain-containing protein [Candidatus Dadabacteria bacterium]
MMEEARRGWDSDFGKFGAVHHSRILESILRSYPGSSEEEKASWKRNVPALQREVGEVVEIRTDAGMFTAILEYELPMESRRADVVLLLHDGVAVVELKGKSVPSDADIDQAHAYARDLSCYHRDCHGRQVKAVLVPTRMRGKGRIERGVKVCSPDELDSLIGRLGSRNLPESIDVRSFLSADAYQPLPSLVRAARELFLKRRPPQLWRSVANTDRAVHTAREIASHACATGTRRLVLLTGVPGAGKTLVGLRLAHMPGLDDLAQGNRGVPAVFLSGNGPLVEVLQYVLRSAGGNGKTFVRPIREYVRRYARKGALVPPEHVMIFDEAQRAHDRERVADVHKIDLSGARSEPEHFIEFAERVPKWSVVVGLIGSGQEIYVGEEGGLGLWAEALLRSGRRNEWTVHGPPQMRQFFEGLPFQASEDLSLDETIRSHFASRLHEFVGKLVKTPPEPHDELRRIADVLEKEGHDLRVTRDLDHAKRYLRERYGNYPEARFGLMASSRDKDLVRFGVPNDYQSTKQIRFGPWYNDDEDASGSMSCRHLRDCITEFGAQGLELDAVLLAWGTDFVLENGRWSSARAKGFKKGGKSRVHDPHQLRANSYRVLLTRGRDAHVVFVPECSYLEETWKFLRASGFRELADPL